MKQIRQGVFETNSSSTHSVTIYGAEDKYIYPTHIPTIEFGEYGWEKNLYPHFTDKLSYVITMIGSKCVGYNESEEVIKEQFLVTPHFMWLSDVVQSVCGVELKIEFSEGWNPLGYIDHQSIDTLDAFWSDEEDEFKSKMKEFIFNEKYAFETDKTIIRRNHETN